MLPARSCEFRGLAKELNAALVLVHHTRKGLMNPGEMEAARGASSVVSAARIGLTVVIMAADDEKALGLPPGARNRYFRLDGGKANYSLLLECEWYERVSYELEQGDQVGVATPWYPPEDVVTLNMRAKVEAAIRQGSPSGPWSPKLESRARSIRHPMVAAGIIKPKMQKKLLADLFLSGFEQAFVRDGQRKRVHGLRAPDGQPSRFEWQPERTA